MDAWVADVFGGEVAQRIGWALIHFLWQATAVALLLLPTLQLLRRRPAQVRWLVCCVALGLMAAAPLATACLVTIEPAAVEAVEPRLLPVAEAPLPPVPADSADSGNAFAGPPVTKAVTPEADAELVAPILPPQITALPTAAAQTSTEEARAAAWIEPALPWLMAVWLGGVILLSLWQIGGWLHLEHLKRRDTRPVTGRIAELFATLRHRLSVSRPVRLLESARLAAPIVVGWLRPVVLLPASALSSLSAEQLEAILAHELAHVRRYDCLVRMLQVIAETLLFYHPAVWWVSRRITEEGEHCCDELAVAHVGDRRGYASALARVAELSRRRHPHLAAAARGGRLADRIRRILGLASPDDGARAGWIAVALSCLIVTALIVCSHPATGDVDTAPPAQNETDSVEWGQATEEGLQCRLRCQRERFYPGEIPVLLADVRNTGQSDLEVGQVYRLAELEYDGMTYTWTPNERSRVRYDDQRTPLVAHTSTEDIEVRLDPSNSGTGSWQLDKKGGIAFFAGRKYAVRLTFVGTDPATGKEVRATSNRIEIPIYDKDILPKFLNTLGHPRSAEMIRPMLAKHPDLATVCCHDGRRPILSAASGSLDTVKLLMDHGARVNVCNDDGETPLHRAALGGKTDVIRLLLNRGLDIDAAELRNGKTPLHFAAENGQAAAIRLLLSHGANVNAHCTIGDATPIQLAAFLGRIEAVNTLAEGGAELDLLTASCIGRADRVSELLKADPDSVRTTSFDLTPLHGAAWQGQAETARLLIEAGADVNARARAWDQPPPIIVAASAGNKDVVALLLDHGAEVDVTDEKGATALSRAASRGHRETCELLLKRGADVNARNKSGYGPLAAAAGQGHVELTQLLLDKGADARGSKAKPCLVLHAVARSYYAARRPEAAKVVEIVLGAGADPNARDSRGDTVLHRLVEAAGDRESAELLAKMARLLIKAKAEVDATDGQGNTPLYRLVLHGHAAAGTPLVETLINAGADPTLTGSGGISVLTLAWRHGGKETAELLRTSLVVRAAEEEATVAVKELVERIAAGDEATIGGLVLGEQHGGISPKGWRKTARQFHDTYGEKVHRLTEILDVMADGPFAAGMVARPDPDRPLSNENPNTLVQMIQMPDGRWLAHGLKTTTLGPDRLATYLSQLEVGTLWARLMADVGRADEVPLSRGSVGLDVWPRAAPLQRLTLTANGGRLNAAFDASMKEAHRNFRIEVRPGEIRLWQRRAFRRAEVFSYRATDFTVRAAKGKLTATSGNRTMAVEARGDTVHISIGGSTLAASSVTMELPSLEIADQRSASTLEFRIAPTVASMSEAELKSYRDWLAAGRIGFWWKGGRIAGRMPECAWLPVAEKLASQKGVSDNLRLVIGQYKGALYVLVSDKPSEAMSSLAAGKEAWSLKSVRADTTPDTPCVVFGLDDRGAKLFSTLTGANVGKCLAMVVAGRVVGAPRLMSRLTNQGVIVGQFSEQDAKKIADTLKPLVHGQANGEGVVDRVAVEAVPPRGEFFIQGEVARPGVYSLQKPGMTVSQAIRTVGGLTANGNPAGVTVTRQLDARSEKVIHVDLGRVASGDTPDVTVENGDLIRVAAKGGIDSNATSEVVARMFMTALKRGHVETATRLSVGSSLGWRTKAELRDHPMPAPVGICAELLKETGDEIRRDAKQPETLDQLAWSLVRDNAAVVRFGAEQQVNVLLLKTSDGWRVWSVDADRGTLEARLARYVRWLATSPILREATRHRARALVAKLRNSDVTWDGNFAGLHPTVVGPTAKALLAMGGDATAALVEAVSDQEKFAAAHVLLTTMVYKTEFTLDASQWNGLRVDLTADGRTVLHPEQIPELVKRWRQMPGAWGPTVNGLRARLVCEANRFTVGQKIPARLEIECVAGFPKGRASCQLFPRVTIWYDVGPDGGKRPLKSLTVKLPIENRITISQGEVFTHTFDLTEVLAIKSPSRYRVMAGHANGDVKEVGDWAGDVRSGWVGFDVGDSVAGAATRFLEAVAAGRLAEAGAMTDPASAVAQQLDEVRKVADFKKLTIAGGTGDDEVALLGTSETTDDRDRKGLLVLTLKRQAGRWLVSDIDFVTPEKAETLGPAFLKAHPAAKTIEPVQAEVVATELPGSKMSLAKALKEEGLLIALCEAQDHEDGWARISMSFVSAARQKFSVVQPLAGKWTAKEVSIGYNTIDGVQRVLKKGERVIWMVRPTKEGESWYAPDHYWGLKALTDTPENRKALGVAAAVSPAGGSVDLGAWGEAAEGDHGAGMKPDDAKALQRLAKGAERIFVGTVANLQNRVEQDGLVHYQLHVDWAVKGMAGIGLLDLGRPAMFGADRFRAGDRVLLLLRSVGDVSPTLRTFAAAGGETAYPIVDGLVDGPTGRRSLAEYMACLSAATDKVVWGQAAGGLRLRLAPAAESEYRRMGTLPLVLEVQNVGDAPIQMSRVSPRLNVEATDGAGSKLVVRPPVGFCLWEGRMSDGQLPPGGIVRWPFGFDRLRFAKDLAAGSTVRLSVSLFHDRVRCTSNRIDLKITGAFPTRLGRGSVPDVWAGFMDLVYREESMRRLLAVHVGGKGRTELCEVTGGKHEYAPSGRLETVLSKERLDRLAAFLHGIDIGRIAALPELVAWPDEPVTRLSLVVAGQSLVRAFPARQVRGDPTLTALEAMMRGLIAEAADQARQEQRQWGPPSQGVRVRLTADRLAWKQGEVPRLVADARSDGFRRAIVPASQHGFALEIDGRHYRWTGRGHFKSGELLPDRRRSDMAVVLDNHWTIDGGSHLDLAPGKHTVRVVVPCTPAEGGRFFSAVSNTVAVEVLSPAAFERVTVALTSTWANNRTITIEPDGSYRFEMQVLANVPGEDFRTVAREPYVATYRLSSGDRLELERLLASTDWLSAEARVDQRLRDGVRYTMTVERGGTTTKATCYGKQDNRYDGLIRFLRSIDRQEWLLYQLGPAGEDVGHWLHVLDGELKGMLGVPHAARPQVPARDYGRLLPTLTAIVKQENDTQQALARKAIEAIKSLSVQQGEADFVWGEAVGGVRCAVKLLSETVTPDNDIAMLLFYQNVSQEPITVCVYPDPFYVWTLLEIVGADGRVVARGPHANGVQANINASHFVTLAPWQTTSVRYDLRRSRMGKPKLKPGAYRVRVTMNKINKLWEHVPGLPELTKARGIDLWKGVVESGFAKLTIVEGPDVPWSDPVGGLAWRVYRGKRNVKATAMITGGDVLMMDITNRGDLPVAIPMLLGEVPFVQIDIEGHPGILSPAMAGGTVNLPRLLEPGDVVTANLSSLYGVAYGNTARATSWVAFVPADKPYRVQVSMEIRDGRLIGRGGLAMDLANSLDADHRGKTYPWWTGRLTASQVMRLPGGPPADTVRRVRWGDSWGEPVGGLRVRLGPPDATGSGPHMPFLRAEVQNGGAQAWKASLNRLVHQLEVDGVRYRWTRPATAKAIRLDPGEGCWVEPLTRDAKWRNLANGESLSLSPGKHKVRVVLQLDRAGNAPAQPVELLSNVIEVEIGAADRANNVSMVTFAHEAGGETVAVLDSAQKKVLYYRAKNGVREIKSVGRWSWADDGTRGLEVQLSSVAGTPEACRLRAMGTDVADTAALAKLLKGYIKAQAKGGGGDLAKVSITIAPDEAVWQKHIVGVFDIVIAVGFKNVRFVLLGDKPTPEVDEVKPKEAEAAEGTMYVTLGKDADSGKTTVSGVVVDDRAALEKRIDVMADELRQLGGDPRKTKLVLRYDEGMDMEMIGATIIRAHKLGFRQWVVSDAGASGASP